MTSLSPTISATPIVATEYRWGQINKRKRFRQIALDLDAAIDFASLNMAELRVLKTAMHHSWTLPKMASKGGDTEPVPVGLSAYRIAQDNHLQPNQVRRAIRSLLAARILLQSAGLYLINKRADDWVGPTGLPLISDERLQTCRRLMMEGVETYPNVGYERTPSRGRDVPLDRVETYPLVGSICTPSDAMSTSYIAPVAHAELDLIQIEEEQTQDAGVCVPSIQEKTLDPSPKADLTPKATGTSAATLTAHMDVEKLADKWFPMRELGIAIARDRFSFAPEIWHEGLTRLKLCEATKVTLRYLKGICVRLEKEDWKPDLTLTPKMAEWDRPCSAEEAKERALSNAHWAKINAGYRAIAAARNAEASVPIDTTPMSPEAFRAAVVSVSNGFIDNTASETIARQKRNADFIKKLKAEMAAKAQASATL